MVDWGSDYWHTLDKMNIKTRDLGVSSKMGEVVQSLKADITAGASHVELGFTGMQKGSLGQGNTTPEMFDTRKREEIRQMAKLNRVTVSTHASLGVSGLAGMDREGRFFSDRQAENTLTEIKRTIDFAGEACEGGPVVVHTGEFPREISEYKDFEPPFGVRQEEVVSLVDKDTGQIIRFQKGQTVHTPKEWVRNDKKQLINIKGEVVNDPFNYLEMVPKTNKEGEIEFKAIKFDDIQKDVNDYNKTQSDKSKWRNADKEFYILAQREQLERAFPFAHNYSTRYHELREQADELKKKYEQWKKTESQSNAEQKEYLKDVFQAELGGKTKLKDDQLPSQFLEKEIERVQQYAQAEKEGFIGYAKEIEKIKHMQGNIKPIQEVGVNRSAETLAKAAMYARKRTEDLRKNPSYKEMREVFIAPENIFPESGYGSHPDELKNIIEQSRKKMVDLMTKKELEMEGKKQTNPYFQQGVSKDEATQIAEKYIKATFDIGHAYTWKKYYKGEKKDFDKWLMKKVEELNKDKIIGHVHISDNFGYYDEHLTPGLGEVPIDQFIKKMKESGFDKPMVVEWGAQKDPEESYGAMVGAWARAASSPIYRIDGMQQKWSDIQDVGYFGRSSSPNFITGSYAPSKEWNAWGWSEAPIE